MSKTRNATRKGDQDFAKACRAWAISDHWPLQDAVNLVLGTLPRCLQTGKLNGKLVLRQKKLYEIALNCIGASLPTINQQILPNEYRVRPDDFITWAERIIQIPDDLTNALAEMGELLGKKEPLKELGRKQRHRERCRAIAAFLWAQHPSLTKGQVAQRAEILHHACEDRRYAQSTIEEWIKTENPNTKGGRPRKNP